MCKRVNVCVSVRVSVYVRICPPVLLYFLPCVFVCHMRRQHLCLRAPLSQRLLGGLWFVVVCVDLTALLDVANYYGGSNVVHPSGNISSRDHAQKPQAMLTRASSVSALISPRARDAASSELATSDTGRTSLQRLKPVSSPVFVLTALLRVGSLLLCV
jgi:hypothetical protein